MIVLQVYLIIAFWAFVFGGFVLVHEDERGREVPNLIYAFRQGKGWSELGSLIVMSLLWLPVAAVLFLVKRSKDG